MSTGPITQLDPSDFLQILHNLLSTLESNTCKILVTNLKYFTTLRSWKNTPKSVKLTLFKTAAVLKLSKVTPLYFGH